MKKCKCEENYVEIAELYKQGLSIDKLKYQIEKLKEAKQSLISEAVTGKIEVLNYFNL